MIFYYSATGNTRFCADFLADSLHTSAVNILETDCDNLNIHQEDSVGFMFPIYCWGVPPVFEKFVNTILPKLSGENYVWIVATCGDETGVALKKLDTLLKERRGRGADAVFSVIMPNTYVLLPGFDVDKPEVERKKLEDAPQTLKRISHIIENRESGVYEVKEGSFPSLRSAVFPLFVKWGVNTKYWRYSENCIGCGKCAQICPAGNIKMIDNHPLWNNNCFSCCGCFHICPVKAVSYRSFTKGKSQYICPI